jgi:chromosome segregation ATPase
LELQESLIKFNKFLQENESKRKRALARTADEKKQREQKEKEIEEREVEFQETLKKEAQLKKQVDRNLKYQDFLENVVQTVSKFFPEISDVLQRHATLREENLNLLRKKNQDEAEFDNKQRDYINIRKAKENELLNKSNEVAELQKTLEQYKSRSMALQEELDHLTQETAKKTKELGQVIASVGNLRERCEESFRIRHNKPHFDRSDKMSTLPLVEQCGKTKSNLEDIAMFMVDYQSIIVEYCATNHDFRAVSIPRRGNTTSSSYNNSSHHASSATLAHHSNDDGHHSIAAISMANSLR